MSRIVFCKKFQQDLDGLEKPPYPGPKGQEIFDHVSKKAWDEWLTHQTMLINEKKLSMADSQSRKYLSEQMDKFLSGTDYDQAEGYVPPSE